MGARTSMVASLFLALPIACGGLACSGSDGAAQELDGGGGLDGIDTGGGDGNPTGLDGTTGDGSGVGDTGNKCGKTLTGTIRDFKQAHPDFEKFLGDDKGIVKVDLGADGKPVYAPATKSPTTTGKADFDQWYRDVDGVNKAMPLSITMIGPDASGVYTYSNNDFFPIDGKGWGNEGNPHNFHFTYELRTTFQFKGSETFKFTGDDDLFTFINGKLVIDLGGVHGAENQQVKLGDRAAELGLVVGKVYSLDVFFAERHTTQSEFRIDTTLDFVDCGVGIK